MMPDWAKRALGWLAGAGLGALGFMALLIGAKKKAKAEGAIEATNLQAVIAVKTVAELGRQDVEAAKAFEVERAAIEARPEPPPTPEDPTVADAEALIALARKGP